jgi:UDP-glucose 4-epimerase
MTDYILVTGATGFIGSHLCKQLVNHGYHVVGLSKSGKTARLKGIGDTFYLHVADIRDTNALQELFKHYQFKSVFHLAACVPYAKDVDILVNNKGTSNIAYMASLYNVERLVYSSSISVYSTPPEFLPVSEIHPVQPTESYGMSKRAGEMSCQLCKMGNINVTILRYAGVYGLNSDPNRTIPNFVRKALKNKTIVIDGNGTNSSDFVYVDDVVNGTILAWQNNEGIYNNGIYNIGSGKETSIKDLAQNIVELTSSKSKIVLKKNLIERNFRFYLDITKAKKEIGYAPESFRDRLKNYIGLVRGK